jgi:hypothetical protein
MGGGGIGGITSGPLSMGGGGIGGITSGPLSMGGGGIGGITSGPLSMGGGGIGGITSGPLSMGGGGIGGGGSLQASTLAASIPTVLRTSGGVVGGAESKGEARSRSVIARDLTQARFCCQPP